MSYLVHHRSGLRHGLTPVTLVGRSPTSDLCLPAGDVSRFHALIYWSQSTDGGGWRVRDLNSANGTFVGEPSDGAKVECVRLGPGEETALSAQGGIAFGVRDDTWLLAGSEPPPLVLVGQRPDHEIRLTGRALLLPDGETPEAMVYHQPGAGWVLETQSETRRLVADERFTVAGTAWRAIVPQASAETRALAGGVKLVLSVSADEDYVELLAKRGGQRERITGGTGNALYFLLTLARKRLADAADGIPFDEQGWVHSSELAERHRCTETVLNQWVFRMRARVAAAGYDDVEIVQRRPRTGLLRFGHLATELGGAHGGSMMPGVMD